MKAAYVDSSAILAVVFAEPGYTHVKSALNRFDKLFSSSLLEAEVLAALSREKITYPIDSVFDGLNWLTQRKRLSHEIHKVLDVGTLRGADLWHVASALSIVSKPADLTFVTLDRTQREVARKLGFRIL